MRTKQRGFTLVELMIVLALIGLLAAIIIPAFVKIRATSRKSMCQNGQRMVHDAVEQWTMMSNGAEGTPISALDANNIVAYIRGNELPRCQEGNIEIAVPARVGDPVLCPVAAVTAIHTLPH